MKKLLSLLLILSLCISALPVLGAQTEEMEKILLSVKARIPNTEDFEEFNSSVMENDGVKIYSFDWSSNKNETYKSMSVSVLDNGIITNYRYYDDTINSYKTTPAINKMGYAEALLKAQKLVDELNPVIKGEVKVVNTNINESLFDNTYRFQLERVVNGVPVYNNTGNVTVGENAEEIIRYNINYTPNLTFENKDNLISEDDAWKALYEKSGLELKYVSKYNDGKKSVLLIYSPKMKYQQYIDAKTGEISDIWVRNYVYSTNSKEMAADGSGGAAVEESARLSEIEVKKLEEVSGLKSSDEAANAVKDNEILDFDNDLSLTSVNLYKEYDGERYFYDLTFESHINDTYRYSSATLDAKTLEIIRWRARTKDYIRYRENYEDNIKEIDKEDIIKKAYLALKKLAPKYFINNEADYRPNENEQNSNSIAYTRYVNDIVFCDDYVNIEINPENGKVWNFSMNYSDVDFPSPDGIISDEKAVEMLSEQKEYKLVYFPYAAKDEMLYANSAKIGYIIDDITSVEIDAFTGKINENIYLQKKLSYTDIDNHYAKEQIETLARFGIGFEGSEFRPDEIITQNEYITLLMATFSNYTPIILKTANETSAEYKQAQRMGIVNSEEQNPNDALTREYAAIYMIRVIGIEEYAKINSIYKSVFPDVSHNIGYISILAGIGVFKGDENGLFNPYKQLTRADAIIAIYNYLNR